MDQLEIKALKDDLKRKEKALAEMSVVMSAIEAYYACFRKS
jgi:hypothetical protein